jgi:O-antigen/teichoic acid export membrane protein
MSAPAGRVAAGEFARPPAYIATLARYGLSAGGPMATSGAHFVASLIFLRALAPAEFGLFSFLLIVVPFALSIAGSLLGPSLMAALRRTSRIDDATLATHLKANLVIAALAIMAVAALMFASHAGANVALPLGAYGGAMTLRAFGRAYAYAIRKPLRALASDIAYALSLVAGLLALLAANRLTIEHAAIVLPGAAALGLCAFGPAYLARQFQPGGAGSLRAYGAIWQEWARWAAFGVVLTELTANAHAYLVTFISGPKAFAVLALGSLLMRPASLVLTALPDIERPRMAAKIGHDDAAGALRTVKEFRTASAAIWVATILLAAALLMWFPHVILRKGYDGTEAVYVLAFWIVILGIRTLRTPEAVFLQAAGEFRALARASLWSSVTSLTVTLALLLIAGPIFSLTGLIAGDLVMTGNIFRLTRDWKRAHG